VAVTLDEAKHDPRQYRKASDEGQDKAAPGLQADHVETVGMDQKVVGHH
jgi:hypothetical protein